MNNPLIENLLQMAIKSKDEGQKATLIEEISRVSSIGELSYCILKLTSDMSDLQIQQALDALAPIYEPMGITIDSPVCMITPKDAEIEQEYLTALGEFHKARLKLIEVGSRIVQSNQ